MMISSNNELWTKALLTSSCFLFILEFGRNVNHHGKDIYDTFLD